MADYVYFVTNRNPLARNPDRKIRDFGSDFHRKGIGYLRFGKATFYPHNEPYLELVPDRTDPRRFGSSELMDEIRGSMKSQERDTLIYVHGFNNSFKDAITHARELKNELKANGQEMNVGVFTWPADGATIIPRRLRLKSAYYSDRADADASGPALARFILKATDFVRGIEAEHRCERDLHIMFHSMGHHVMESALRYARQFLPRRMPKLFKNAFLMAADVDADAMERPDKLATLREFARQTHIYFNENDEVLTASEEHKQDIERLGRIGPEHPLALPSDITLINTTGVSGREHSQHRKTPVVQEDIQRVLDDVGPDEHGPARKYVASKNHYRLTGR